MKNAIFLSLSILSALSLTACKEAKIKKTCATHGESVAAGTPNPLWAELAISEGEVCGANQTTLKYIVENPNVVEYATTVGDKLEAKGWKPVEGTFHPNTTKGSQPTTSIYYWQFEKDGKAIKLTLHDYPTDIWVGHPVTVDVSAE